jgi:small-conductance mechanosensitive channel
VSESPLILAILKDPAMLVILAPLGLILLGVITFEVAMGVTISTLPRSRFRHKWTPQEQRRVIRVFCCVFSFWPITMSLILAHIFLPMWFALLADLLVIAVVVLCLRWLMHGVKQRKLILAGHCENCLYDLRASHDSNECPECGVKLHDHPMRKKPSTLPAS